MKIATVNSQLRATGELSSYGSDFNSNNNNEIQLGYFEKNKSWVKPGEKTNHLLSHERKHFDLCEVFRRKLIKNLEASKTYNYDSFSDEIEKIFNENFEDYTKEQERYDEETHHSQKIESQIKWNKFISKELLRLKKYDKIAASLNIGD